MLHVYKNLIDDIEISDSVLKLSEFVTLHQCNILHHNITYHNISGYIIISHYG